jgi:hypothetical protein
MIGNGQEMENQKHNIVLHLYEEGMQRISEICYSYAAFHYILMFPRGENGWHPIMILIRNNESIHIYNEEIFESNDDDELNTVSKKYITAINYFAYCFQVGQSEKALTLHRYG